LSRAEPLRDGDGNLVCWVGVNIDVTEQQRLTEDLRRSEREVQQILDLARQLVAVFGPRRERLYINRMSLDRCGITLKEWRESGPGAEVHPDDTERLSSQWDRAISSSSAFVVEAQILRYR
jgi:PAS domain-containing protein